MDSRCFSQPGLERTPHWSRRTWRRRHTFSAWIPHLCQDTVSSEIENGRSEYRRRLDEQRVPLRRSLAECGGAPLVGNLNRPERREVPVHKDGLNALAL